MHSECRWGSNRREVWALGSTEQADVDAGG
jgi:hypothetical protein